MLYAFQLGHQPEISIAEIKTVFLSQKINYKIKNNLNNYLILEITKPIEVDNLIKQLGGTVKICQEIKNDKNNIIQSIVDYLSLVQPEGKIQFSYPDKKNSLDIKKELKNNNRSVRYIEPKNSATIIHNNLKK